MISFVYSLFESIWRRCFGNDGWGLPLLKHRAFQHILNISITFLALKIIGVSFLQNIIATLIFEFLYWTRAHGPAMDMGRDEEPSQSVKDRYEKEFWDKICKRIFPKEKYYGFWYDFVWMFLRYEIYALPISFVLQNVWFSLSGFIVASVYATCWKLEERGKLKHLHATELAEYIVGFTSGLLITL